MRFDLVLVVSGSRYLSGSKHRDTVFASLEECLKQHEIDRVFVGDARGADMFVAQYCEKHEVNYETFHANWTEYGNRAGPMRNERMVSTALEESRKTIGLCFPKVGSTNKGTLHCMSVMNLKNVPMSAVWCDE